MQDLGNDGPNGRSNWKIDRNRVKRRLNTTAFRPVLSLFQAAYIFCCLVILFYPQFFSTNATTTDRIIYTSELCCCSCTRACLIEKDMQQSDRTAG